MVNTSYSDLFLGEVHLVMSTWQQILVTGRMKLVAIGLKKILAYK